MTPEQVKETTILRATVGSTLFGLNISGSDTDEMGVCIEPFSQWVGFTQFEHQVPVPDITIYSLRKFLRLALKGNPTVLTLLFAPENMCSVRTYVGAELQKLAPHIASKRAGKAFLGYLIAQRQRLTGERGQRDVNRQELVDKYGYDTKYAMHMLRLGLQGIEYLQTGTMSLPMKDHNREFLLNVRNGKFTEARCIEEAKLLEEMLKHSIEVSPLPDEPNTANVEDWLMCRYDEAWCGYA